MKQAIAGVAPPELGEVTIHAVRPSMAAWPIGRTIGWLCGAKAGSGFFTIGKLFALALIPLALAIYLRNLGPFFARRYRLTNRRLRIENGLTRTLDSWVSLDDFDAISVSVLPGQEWFPAGELVFRKGAVETFRLSGVPRPEVFRQVCLKTQRAHTGVKQILQRQAKAVAARA